MSPEIAKRRILAALWHSPVLSILQTENLKRNKHPSFSGAFYTQVVVYQRVKTKMVVGDGFEPSKSGTVDLQSTAFGHSATPPTYQRIYGAGEGNRTLTISLEG